MGLYNFKAQFVPFILDGSKTHTIRAPRVHYDIPGKWMYLYTGLRTKKTRFLFRARCVRSEVIRIEADHRVRLACFTVPSGFVDLDESEKNALAWRDGFRPLGSTQERPGDAFELMIRFWDGRLPFLGDLIHWDRNREMRRW